MNDMVGLPEELIEGANRHLSSGTLGEFYAGNMLDAVANGFVFGFNNTVLVPDTIGATLGVTKLTGASAAATEAKFHLIGEKGYLRSRILSTGANAVAATNGIYSSSSFDTVARGVFRFQLGDIDGDACSALDQNTDTWLPFGSAGQDFSVTFGVSGSQNITSDDDNTFAEIGLTDSALDLDPANIAATNRFMFKLAQGKIIFTDGTTTINCGKIPATRFMLTIRYDQRADRLNCMVDSVVKGSISRGSVAAAQLSVRVCHLAAYTALADAPARLDLDYVIANTPNIRPSARV